MPNSSTTPEKPQAVAASSGGNPASIRYATICAVIAYIATAVKKKVENNAQKVWWRSALVSVQPLSTKPASVFFNCVGECSRCGSQVEPYCSSG